MFPTRRSLLLGAAFLGLAVVLSAGHPAQAQNGPPQYGPQQHELWLPGVPADQVRDAFKRGRGPGGPTLTPEYEKLVPGLTREFKNNFPDVDERVAEPAIRELLAKPELQGFPPSLVDDAVRQALTRPEYQKQIRDGIRDAKAKANANAAKTPKTGGNPRVGGPPFDSKKGFPTNPKDRTGDPKAFDPNSPPGPADKDKFRLPPVELPKDLKIDPKDGTDPNPMTGDGPPVRVRPNPKDNPDPKVSPDPTTDPKVGPRPLPKVDGPPTKKSMTDDPMRPVPDTPPKTPDPEPKSPNQKQPDPKQGGLGEGFQQPGANPELDARKKRMEAAKALWEKTVGPLDDTPQVKKALFDLVDGTDDIKDKDGNSFWDTLSKEGADSGSFADWVNNAATGDSWKFDFWGKSSSDSTSGSSSSSSSGGNWFTRQSSSSSSSPRGGSGGGLDFGFGGASGNGLIPLLILAALLVGGLLLFKYLYFRDPRAAEPAFDLGGIGPWPVDPRAIATRQDLVKAFEYLGVMICGPAARMWTHGTIASALAELATTHSEAAMILARLYELARYAPLDEPLTAAEIEEARRLVCRLAGVSYP